MDTATFNAPTAKGRPKAIKTRDGTEVAARYFVYKLYEATGGQPMQWQVLFGMGESAATRHESLRSHPPPDRSRLEAEAEALVDQPR